MELKNCRQCGKVYIYNGSYLCMNCQDEMERQFTLVKEYISKNPQADIETIEKDTGVESKLILRLIREGRLQYKGKDGLVCKRCSTPIDTGYYCKECMQQLNQYVNHLMDQSAPSSDSKKAYHIDRKQK